jgi:hypothetical protein
VGLALFACTDAPYAASTDCLALGCFVNRSGFEIAVSDRYMLFFGRPKIGAANHKRKSFAMIRPRMTMR